MKKRISLLYFLLLLVHLMAIPAQLPWVHAVSKISLMPLLIAYTLWQKNHSSHIKPWLTLALLFSWAGDIFLLVDHLQPFFFIAGLSAFLIAHLSYIICFARHAKKRDFWGRKVAVAAVAGVYVFIMILYLSPHLNSLFWPVTAYALVLGAMFVHATGVFPLSTLQGALLTGGALLFVLSDSFLAINKFAHAIPLASPSIMLTYAAAQWCLTIALTEPQVSGGNANFAG